MARKTTKSPAAKEPKAVEKTETSTGETLLKKPELLDEIVTRTNLKKRDVKPAIEAALAILGDALAAGRELNMPPLGKVRVVKAKDINGGATVITLKLRTPKNASAAAAEPSED